jgi:hypothetical protein
MLPCQSTILSLIRAAFGWCFSLLFHVGSEQPNVLFSKGFQPSWNTHSRCNRENLPANSESHHHFVRRLTPNEATGNRMQRLDPGRGDQNASSPVCTPAFPSGVTTFGWITTVIGTAGLLYGAMKTVRTP